MARGDKRRTARREIGSDELTRTTGIAALDDAVREFLEHGLILEGGPERLRSQSGADGICSIVGEQLTTFLVSRGFASWGAWIHAAEIYPRRPLPGYHDHYVTFVEQDGVRFALDLTAAQYGFSALPLVSRRTPSGWALQWDPLTAPVVRDGRWTAPACEELEGVAATS